MIKSPKEKFQSSQPRCQQWEQIVANRIFDEACDHALLHMQEQMPVTAELAYGAHMQMTGALLVIRILKTIHETTQEPAKKTFQGLNYKEGV